MTESHADLGILTNRLNWSKKSEKPRCQGTTTSRYNNNINNIKQSSKKPVFDPYLKYTFNSNLNSHSQFGQITLVSLSKQDPVLAMKKIELTVLDEKETTRQLQKRIELNSRAAGNSFNQAEYELLRLKATEYERVIKFLKTLLNHTVKHSNLIKIIDTFTSRDLKSSYIVMDYHNNTSLKTRLAEHLEANLVIPFSLVKKWFEQSIEGLLSRSV